MYEDECGSTIRHAIYYTGAWVCVFGESNIPSIARRGYIEIDYIQTATADVEGG